MERALYSLNIMIYSEQLLPVGFLAPEATWNGHPRALGKRAKAGPCILALHCLLLCSRLATLVQKPLRCQTQIFIHLFALYIAKIILVLAI